MLEPQARDQDLHGRQGHQILRRASDVLEVPVEASAPSQQKGHLLEKRRHRCHHIRLRHLALLGRTDRRRQEYTFLYAVTADSKSKIILSPSDILYLNKGQGNLWLNATQGNYSNWRQIYENLVVFPAGVDQSRILGAEVCLWGEVSNEDTLENNLFMRSTSFAGRVWSSKILKTHEVVANLVSIQYALYDMNVDASPVTSEFCERKPALCWPPQKTEFASEEEAFLSIVAE